MANAKPKDKDIPLEIEESVDIIESTPTTETEGLINEAPVVETLEVSPKTKQSVITEVAPVRVLAPAADPGAAERERLRRRLLGYN